MDKRGIVMAYRKGVLTREQCAQMLGIDSEPLLGLVSGESQRLLPPTERGANAPAGRTRLFPGKRFGKARS